MSPVLVALFLSLPLTPRLPQVNMLSLVFMIAYVPIAFPSAWLLDTAGLWFGVLCYLLIPDLAWHPLTPPMHAADDGFDVDDGGRMGAGCWRVELLASLWWAGASTTDSVRFLWLMVSYWLTVSHPLRCWRG